MNKITVTIKRTFTPDDDPFGLFSLFSMGGTAEHAVVELRYDTMQRDHDDDGGLSRLRDVDNLLDDAEWEVSAE